MTFKSMALGKQNLFLTQKIDLKLPKLKELGKRDNSKCYRINKYKTVFIVSISVAKKQQ